MIRERVLAGLARAKEQGTSLGRRRLEDTDAPKVAAIKAALAAKKGCQDRPRSQGWSWDSVAAEGGISCTAKGPFEKIGCAFVYRVLSMVAELSSPEPRPINVQRAPCQGSNGLSGKPLSAAL
jgi:hypothetical protein